MTEFHEEAPVSAYGAARRAAWLADLRRKTEAAASISAHRADHDVITAGQAGIFGPGATGEQMAADVAARRPRVGED